MATDPRIAAIAAEQMLRMSRQPCECAARAVRKEFPLKPEDVKCVPCRMKEALARPINAE